MRTYKESLLTNFSNNCHRIFFTDDYVSTLAVSVGLLAAVLALAQLHRKLADSHHSVAMRAIVICTVALAAVLAMICVIGDGTQMQYKLDYAKYTPNYQSANW